MESHSFDTISRVATQPNLLAANPARLPVKSVAELVKYAKANPGKVAYGSNGNGSPQHLAAELLKRMAGIDLVHVPYKGAAPTAQALLAGEVSIAFNIILLPLPYVQSGRLSGLAVASSHRSPLAPGLPTMAELGYPIDIDTWYGLVAPAGTPRAVINRLFDATATALKDPKLEQILANDGTETAPSKSPEDFAAWLRDEGKLWARLVKESGAKVD